MTKCCALGLALSLVLEGRWMQPVGTEMAKAGWAPALACFHLFIFPLLIWLITFGALSLLLVQFSSYQIQSASLLHN